MIESPLLKHYSGYINGQWVNADTGETLPVHNPANGQLLANVPKMGAAETTRAIEAAAATLRKPASLDQRREWLEAIAQALTDHREEIGRILTSEHGKPLKEGQGEADYAAGFFSYCAKHVHELAPRQLEERPRDCSWTVHYRPAGVVGLVTPWNFPIGMIAKKLSAALAADCPSVIKPSSKTPLTMIALFTLLDEVVKLPAGKVNLVMGSSGPIGDTLLEHPDVQVLSFTGSTEVGRELIRKAAPQGKKLTLELGGNAPFMVFDDADLDAAADNLIANKFRGGGQTCVCANRILVHEAVADAFGAKVTERVNRLKVGDGMASDTDIGPLIDRNGYHKVRRHVADAVDKGARIIAGKLPDPIETDWGGFFPPTVLQGATPDMACWTEETFGPLVPLVTFRSDEEALEMANQTEFGLASYLFTADEKRAEKVIAGLQFAHVCWNTGTGPAPEAPFGGMKQSGYGREGGIEGLFEFIEPQTVPRGA
ncbi:MAG: NAD-dependent succinate-semialdehyde dehydrogenase [Ectothiorhodospiraceae bacterium]|nr:NAD-dependent succinate-semialdehyde dehydrogenase [Ectothiorhodospiraceae bacterium]